MALEHAPLHAAFSDRELITEFVVHADVTDATRVKYRTHLGAFVDWLGTYGCHPSRSGPLLLQAEPVDAQRFMTHLREGREAGASGAELSASTRKNYLASLRSFYRYSVSVKLTQSDPTSGIRAPRVMRTPGICLTAEELRRLLRVGGPARDRIQTYLLVFTAARSGELRNLRWSDIDIINRTMRVRGKGGRYRVIDIHPELMVELNRWHVHLDHTALHSPAIANARRDPQTNFVLLTRTGKQVRPSTLYRQLKRRAFLADLYPLEAKGKEYRSKVSPHALRRSFATLLLNEGHPIDAVADVLGHASLDTTRAHYAFSSNARRRATIEAFNV